MLMSDALQAASKAACSRKARQLPRLGLRVPLVTVPEPCLIAAILDGTEPDGLSLAKLVNLPCRVGVARRVKIALPGSIAEIGR